MTPTKPPEWFLLHREQIDGLIGRVKDDEVLLVIRVRRNARLPDELQPGGIGIRAGAVKLTKLDERTRRDVETVQRGRRHGNNTLWSWGSCRFLVDGNATEGLVALEFEDELEPRIIESNVQDGVPLGMSAGRYRIGLFPMRMLSDSAVALKRYLASKGAAQGIGSYSATFNLGVQLVGIDAGDFMPSTTALVSCRIVGERTVHEEGIDEALTEFKVGCLAITRDGVSLYNALAGVGPTAAFPAVDSITLGPGPAPGKWTLISAPKINDMEIRKGAYMDGATIVPTGASPVEIEFMAEFWDPVDFVAFKLFRASYLKKPLIGVPGAFAAAALGIYHPELNELGVTSVVVKEIQPVLNDGTGVWTTRVKFLQYTGAPKPALAKPDATIPDTAPPMPTALSNLQREVDDATAELHTVSGQ